jgi:DNA-binding NarL/FixJ family response regulator
LILQPNHNANTEEFNEGRSRLVQELAARLADARLVQLAAALTPAALNPPDAIAAEVDAFLDDGAPLRGTPAVATDGTDVAAEAATLSGREREVLPLIADGMSNRAIADELVIAESTVANHVRSILTKTGTANRTEAGTWAVRHGLAGE